MGTALAVVAACSGKFAGFDMHDLLMWVVGFEARWRSETQRWATKGTSM